MVGPLARRGWLLLGVALAVAASVAICGCRGRALDSPTKQVVRVQCGPSLGLAMNDLAAAFSASHPEARVVASATCPLCVLPLDQGGEPPFDVVVSVGDEDMERLVKAGYVDAASVVEIGLTGISIVVPRGSTLSIDSVDDLASPEVEGIHLGDPDSVSIGRAVEDALRKAGVWDEVSGKLVDCRTGCEVLKSIALGQGQVGFVYDFCLATPEGADVVLAAHLDPALHASVPLKLGLAPAAAAERWPGLFRDLALCPEGRAILGNYSITFAGACGPSEESKQELKSTGP
jgi:molybdate transport system substrate-binding protein